MDSQRLRKLEARFYESVPASLPGDPIDPKDEIPPAIAAAMGMMNDPCHGSPAASSPAMTRQMDDETFLGRTPLVEPPSGAFLHPSPAHHHQQLQQLQQQQQQQQQMTPRHGAAAPRSRHLIDSTPPHPPSSTLLFPAPPPEVLAPLPRKASEAPAPPSNPQAASSPANNNATTKRHTPQTGPIPTTTMNNNNNNATATAMTTVERDGTRPQQPSLDDLWRKPSSRGLISGGVVRQPSFSTSDVLDDEGGGGGGGHDREAMVEEQQQRRASGATAGPRGGSPLTLPHPHPHPNSTTPQRAASSVLEAELRQLRAEQASLRSALDAAIAARHAAEAANATLTTQLAERDKAMDTGRALLVRLGRRLSTADRHRAAWEIASLKGSLGSIGVQHFGRQVFECWEDGLEFQVRLTRRRQIEQEKSELEVARKDLKRQNPPPSFIGGSIDANHASGGSNSFLVSPQKLPIDEIARMDDVIRGKMEALKREDKRLEEEMKDLEVKKRQFVREMRRFQDEGESITFRDASTSLLQKRYVLTKLLGKGGFSEVFRAIDLQEMCEVAVKIHKVESTWPEARKMQYIRHSIREFDISKNLHHRRIVQFLDVFEIDANTFATVMELCEGGDLDQHLRTHGHLPEREARTILLQVVEGLVYLNEAGENKPRVIHYDLKPANCLTTTMNEIKLTDFGLSKVYEDGQTLQGVEQTSQGAGTLWYLPPEVFDRSPQLRITSKVDVWSVGVMFFQMLFGKRPFGDDQSQEQLLVNNTIRSQALRGVEFPGGGAFRVSQEAKEFIARCLTVDLASRPDVKQLWEDPYLIASMAKGGKK